MTDDRMTSAERSSLLVLIRQRERVAKADAAEYAATLMVDFDDESLKPRSKRG
jgi:hypothetical protein